MTSTRREVRLMKAVATPSSVPMPAIDPGL
jgi:hypothetical protein